MTDLHAQRPTAEPSHAPRPEIDLVEFAKRIRALFVLPWEHKEAATFNEAIDLAARFVISFVDREQFLPLKMHDDEVTRAETSATRPPTGSTAKIADGDQ